MADKKTDSQKTQGSENSTGNNAQDANGSKPKQKGRKGSTISNESNETWTCESCNTKYNNKNDMLLTCEYCESHKCITCLGMSKSVYKAVSGRQDLPWFCDKCLLKSLQSVKNTKTLEERCNDFLASFQAHVDKKFSSIELEINELKHTVCNLKQDLVEELKPTIEHQAEQVLNKDNEGKPVDNRDIIVKATTEIQARFDRKNNIALFNVPESASLLKADILSHDSTFLKDLSEELQIELGKDDIKGHKRVGRRDQTRTFKGKEVKVSRILIVTCSEEGKAKIMKNAYKLKSSDSDIFKGVGIKHDMTREERQKDNELKVLAKQKQDEDESGNFIYIVRGMPWERKVVKLRKRDGLTGPAEVG